MPTNSVLLFLAMVCLSIENSICQHGDSKRDFGIFPGTKWCGRGSLATSYYDLGQYRKTDKCCRYHDKHCKARINAFSKKYGLWNLSFKTSSHCNCEVRFRNCLRKVNNWASKSLTYIYFKLIEPRCFRFKYVRVCARKSWWRCVRRKTVKRAYYVSLKKAIG